MMLETTEDLLVEEPMQKDSKMISTYTFQRVRTLHSDGKSAREIAKTLRVSRKTVGRYVKSNTPPKYPKRRVHKSSLVEQIYPAVRSILVVNNKNSKREVRKELLKQKIFASLSTISRAMARYRSTLPKEMFFAQVYEPGEQIQVDFKEELELPFSDGLRKVQLFVGSLPYSGAVTGKAFPQKNFSCFVEGLHSCMELLGGVPGNLRFDNLSPCVTKILKGKDRIYTQAFTAATDYYGFGLLPCRPGKGSDKGHVERDIQSFSRWITNAVINENMVFESWEQLNCWLQKFFEEQWSPSQREKLEEERRIFRPLPPRNESILCKIKSTSVGPFGIVSISNGIYSVPDNFIGVQCDIIQSAFTVEIRHKTLGVKSVFHNLVLEGAKSIELVHVLTSLSRKPGAMLRWEHKDVLFPTLASKKLYEHIKKLDAYSAERTYLQCLNLIHQVSWNDLNAGFELVLDSKNPFEDLVKLTLQDHRPKNLPSQNELQLNLSAYDALIPGFKNKTEGNSNDTDSANRNTQEIETNDDSSKLSRNCTEISREESNVRTISVGTCSVGGESETRKQSKSVIETSEGTDSKDPVELQFHRPTRHHTRRYRRACQRRLGSKRAQHSPVWGIRSWENPSSPGNFASIMPGGVPLLFFVSGTAHEYAGGGKTEFRPQQTRTQARQVRPNRVRRTGLRFSVAGGCGTFLPADCSTLRKKKSSHYDQSGFQPVGQCLSKNLDDTSCSRPSSASLQDFQYKRSQPTGSGCWNSQSTLDSIEMNE